MTPIDLRLTLLQERVLVVRIRVVQVTDHGADLVRVRTSQLHAVLRTTHLARGHHLHGLRDLLSALHTRDLRADFLSAWHGSRISCLVRARRRRRLRSAT